MKVIISGGGTGGHVYPAITIADAIKNKRPDAEILFVGARGKLEMEKVPAAGYPIKGLWISGFQRKLTWQNLLFPLKLVLSLWKANTIIRQFKPDVVVGVGGYASGPLLNMAERNRIPTVLQEQNSFPGVTNRLLAKKAAKICVAYEGMDRFFDKGKLVLTGNPVRSGFFQNLDQKKAEAQQHFGLHTDKKTLFVFGGSLGARTINQALEASSELLKSRKDVQVIWQIGKLYIEQFANCETAKLEQVVTRVFIDRMDLAYAMADVVIGRAGALTISELCLVGKPAILVPSPNVAEDHQTKNARALVEKKAAVMVEDAKALTDLIPAALNILDNLETQSTLSRNIRRLAKPEAADQIAQTILSLVVR